MITTVRKVPPVVTDLGIGLAVAALLIADARSGAGPIGVPDPRPVDLGAIGLAALLAGVLALRRRHPFEVLIAVNAIMVVWLLASYPGRVVALVPLIGVFTVAAHRGWARGLAASVVTGLAVVLVSFTVEGFDVLGVPPNPEVIGTAYAAGAAVHYRRELLSAIRGNLARDARARAERARRREVEQRLLIAREVHDIVGHAMATISVQAGVAIHVIEQRPAQALEALTAIKKISDEGLADVKSIVATLHADHETGPPRTPPARLDQLDSLLDATRASGLRVDLTVTGARRPLPAAVDLAAYRIVQESLTNALRHADARTVRLDLDYEPSRLAITVRDDGVAVVAAADGHGVTGMRERATALSGRFTAGTHPDGGFEVHCVLPTGDEP